MFCSRAAGLHEGVSRHRYMSPRGAMTTEGRSPRSRCRGCRKPTELRSRHRRIHHQRRSCRYLSIVPLWESGCAECGCVVEEEAEMGIDRTRHGNLSALGH